MLDGPGSEPIRIGTGQNVSELDGAEVHTRRTWAGADPETELASQTWPAQEQGGANPSTAKQGPSSPMLHGP
jgi:hypothetical protein